MRNLDRPIDRPTTGGFKASRAGFTIIEVLVAIMLLTITIVVVLGPLTGMFGLSRKSGDQASATNVAQGVIEQVRGEWLATPKYTSACITATSLPDNTTVSIQNFNAKREAVGTAFNLVLDAACGDSPPDPDPNVPLRQVTVTSTVNGLTTSFEVEVSHP